jgi:hypothetical protein
MEGAEEKRRIATGIAVQAGALKFCQIHEDCLYQGNADVVEAYKLASSKFSAGEFTSVFKSQRDMTDVIERVVGDCSLIDSCPVCAKVMDE